jgi:hypothetical protein
MENGLSLAMPVFLGSSDLTARLVYALLNQATTLVASATDNAAPDRQFRYPVYYFCPDSAVGIT